MTTPSIKDLNQKDNDCYCTCFGLRLIF